MTKALTIPTGIRTALAAHDRAYCQFTKKTSLLRSVFEQHVLGAMQTRTPSGLRMCLPAAEEILEWLARFMMSGMCDEIASRWPDAEVPLVSATTTIVTPEGSFAFRGMLHMRFTPLRRLAYRYAAWLDEAQFQHGDTDITTSLGMTHVVHPQLLLELRCRLYEGEAWKSLDTWIQARTNAWLQPTDS